MPHKIRVARDAAKVLDACPKTLQNRIANRIRDLATNPRPSDGKELKDANGLLRVKVGDHRIVYRFDPGAGIVDVVRIGHRSDVYKHLARIRL